MAIHITTATTTVIPQCAGIIIVVNAALTGTITVNDTATTQAVITNPAVGNQFVYYGSVGAFSLVTNAVCDISVNPLSRTLM